MTSPTVDAVLEAVRFEVSNRSVWRILLPSAMEADWKSADESIIESEQPDSAPTRQRLRTKRKGKYRMELYRERSVSFTTRRDSNTVCIGQIQKNFSRNRRRS
jgi:hypothetical protein